MLATGNARWWRNGKPTNGEKVLYLHPAQGEVDGCAAGRNHRPNGADRVLKSAAPKSAMMFKGCSESVPNCADASPAACRSAQSGRDAFVRDITAAPARWQRCGCRRAAPPVSGQSSPGCVPAAEIHWSTPCGNPLSKYGWNPAARERTCHDPSSSCVFSRY